MTMDEVMPGLWVGDLSSALDAGTLREKSIGSVLSAMRGRVSIHPTFIRHQINLDDQEDADVLTYLVPAISFIQGELDKGRGVLIHCQAGLSRSATIAAAYLMYARNMDPAAALDLIRKVRPNIQPNVGFLQQLDIFYKASFKVSRRDKSTRMFYLERAVAEMMNGDGEIETEMFARYPPTPSDSVPPTPGGLHRRIRCKMCRTELARREHMMDHGQIGPATPAVPMGLSPANSRRSSMAEQPRMGGRRGSGNLTDRRPSASATVPRRPSGLANDLSMALLRGGLSMTSTTDTHNIDVFEDDSGDEEAEPESSGTHTQPSDAMTVLPRSRSGSMAALHPKRLAHLISDSVAVGRGMSDSLSMTAAQEGAATLPTPPRSQARSRRSSANVPEGTTRSLSDSLSMTTLANGEEDEESMSDTAPMPVPISRRESSSMAKKPTLPLITENQPLPPSTVTSPTDPNGKMLSESPATDPDSAKSAKPPPLSHGSDLAAQLFANPKLAALRSPMAMTPIQQAPARPIQAVPAPILINSKCSGYFLEPMKWMEPFLEQGQLAGKIVCPNKKCGAKLGNYDWAGVCCSCKEWVTPGFCIHRSKVDEVV
ncbi:hypothetical protein NEOLEDRAFT_1141367 [Neolentinus lepideus HHB14362 ss-1]|uniref:protein-tyrosine-phosphatase n=1 Tax=Neolentinus lepideus HHB14362 ss-1 TaxID=1314782 RepID=A0A165NPX6_9AGAM|nr:hypothetical protein NEOLEDRAFT_1141367 [Neolentinus lepideus HHB14362 ss-1]